MGTLYEYILENLILEGGAAGHMLHPWQLDKITSLNDLVKYYEDLVALFHGSEKRAFVKIDGNNTSMRLVDGEFALDRLTKDPRDIAGVKLRDVDNRFAGNEYGYDKVVKHVLEMFDNAIPAIRPQLKKLGLLDDDQIMLNIEYVAGKTNKVEYNTNFIAIHGLLEIVTKPSGARITVPKAANQKDLDELASILNKSFGSYGFECYTQFPSIMTEQPDFKNLLQETLTISGLGTKKIAAWLKEYGDIEIKKSASVKMTDGKRVQISSISLFNSLRNGANITSLVEEKYIDSTVVGFLMMYLNSELGFRVLDCFENEKLGKTSSQEGIVIYDNNLNGIGAPVKITGKFIYK